MSTQSALQNMLRFRSEPLSFLSRIAEREENISAVELPGGHGVHLVNDPELVGEILVEKSASFSKYLFPGMREVFGDGILNSAGNMHKTVRQSAQPAFHRTQIDQWKKELGAMVADLISAEFNEGEIDVSGFFQKLTLVVAGRILFALDLSEIAGEFFLCIGEMQRLFLQMEASPRAQQSLAETSRRLDDLLRDVLRQQPVARERGQLFRFWNDTGRIDENQLHQELRNFLVAGSLTPTVALSVASWLLATHRDEQKALRDNGHGSFAQSVVNEALRLYPPVWLFIRASSDGVVLDGRSFPTGDLFLICPWTLHRSPKFFPEPGRFIPQRWSEGTERELPRGAFIPFSIGPRNCIGERFGRMISEEVLRRIVRRFSLAPSQRGHDVRWLPRFTLWPADGVWLNISRLD